MVRILCKIFLFLCAVLPLAAHAETFPQRLHGPWDVYLCHMLTPENPLPPDPEQTLTGKTWETKHCGNGKGQGYGTYRLRLPPLPARDEGYEIGLKVAFSAFRLYVFPEQHPEQFLVVDSGHVSTDAETMIPAYQQRTVHFLPKGPEEQWIVLIQVANFQHVRGGLTQPPLLGPGRSIKADFQREWESAIVCVGFMSFMMLYTFMLFIRRREDRASLFLSLTSLMLIFRALATSNLFYYYIPDPEPWLLRLHLAVEYSGLTGGVTFYLMFNHYTFYEQSRLKLVKPFYRLGLCLLAFSLLAPTLVLTSALRFLQIFAVLQMAVAAMTLLRAVRARQEGALLACSGDLAVAFCGIYDILMSSGVLPRTIYITQFGASFFLFIQSQLLAKRFSRAFRTAERLQKELAREVERQTEELSSMMQNIPQGVFVILEDLRIQGKYSQHLEHILGRKELTGLLALDILFQEANLSQEQKDLAASALVAALGEEEFVWDINSVNLPREIVRNGRILELDWNPIVNKEHCIHRILVTVRDVSQVKALELESRRSRAESSMIIEMVHADRESLVSFFDQARQLLDAVDASQDGRQTFIKLHTLKGLARSYGLRRLTTQIHEVEQDLVVHRDKQWQGWDALRFAEQVVRIRATFDEYVRLCREKLRWQDQSASGREFSLEDLLDLERNLRAHDQTRLQRTAEGLLRKHLYHDLKTMILGFKKDIKNLAAELKKAEPELRVVCPELHMSTTADSILRQALLHLINNAVDHGIETVADRAVIHVEARMEGQNFILSFQDDGGGLPIAAVRQLAAERGLLPLDSSLEALANIIFVPGFSTRSESTEVSGRGVGMDAVRGAFEQVGGSVHIELLRTTLDAKGCVPFRILCQLPAVHFLRPLPQAS